MLSLTVAIVGGAVLRARPAAGTLFRAARVPRRRVPRSSTRRSRPLLRTHRAARTGRAPTPTESGDLLGRMVGDVDALQGLYLAGGRAAPSSRLLVGAAAVGGGTPRSCLGAAPGHGRSGSSSAPPWCRSLGWWLGRSAAGRGPAAKGFAQRRAGGAPSAAHRSWSPTGAEGRPRWPGSAETDRTVVRLSRRERVRRRRHRRAGGSPVLGATLTGVLWVAGVGPLRRAPSTASSWRRWRFCALASFDAVSPLPQAARGAFSDPGRGLPACSTSTEASHEVRVPLQRCRLPSRTAHVRPGRELQAALLSPTSRAFSTDEPPLPPGRDGRAARDERRRQDDGRQPAAALSRPRRGSGRAGRARPSRYRRRTFGARSRWRGRTPTFRDVDPRERPPGAARGEDADLRGRASAARIWDWVASLPEGVETFVARRALALRGPTPAHRPGARAAEGRAGPCPRRADRASRPATARTPGGRCLRRARGKTPAAHHAPSRGLDLRRGRRLDGGRLVGTA